MFPSPVSLIPHPRNLSEIHARGGGGPRLHIGEDQIPPPRPRTAARRGIPRAAATAPARRRGPGRQRGRHTPGAGGGRGGTPRAGTPQRGRRPRAGGAAAHPGAGRRAARWPRKGPGRRRCPGRRAVSPGGRCGRDGGKSGPDARPRRGGHFPDGGRPWLGRQHTPDGGARPRAAARRHTPGVERRASPARARADFRRKCLAAGVTWGGQSYTLRQHPARFFPSARRGPGTPRARRRASPGAAGRFLYSKKGATYQKLRNHDSQRTLKQR